MLKYSRICGKVSDMRWSSRTLKPGFERSVIGFDARQIQAESRVASISVQAWPRAEGIDPAFDADFSNGLNLLIAVEPLLGLPDRPSVVAFDLPKSLAISMSSTFGLSLLPLPNPAEWDFLGFDIVDPRTQSSAMHDFLLGVADLKLNARGLIRDAAIGVSVALTSDSAIPEHAPFCPCGVWLKRQPM